MDINKIEELIKVLEGSHTEELAVRKGDYLVCVKKGRKPVVSAAVSGRARLEATSSAAVGRGRPETTEAPPANGQMILAPMVGIFHKVDGVAATGITVTIGQVVGAIESMKLLNDVVAEVSGTITEVIVEDGAPVEYGQPLYRIDGYDETQQ